MYGMWPFGYPPPVGMPYSPNPNGSPVENIERTIKMLERYRRKAMSKEEKEKEKKKKKGFDWTPREVFWAMMVFSLPLAMCWLYVFETFKEQLRHALQ